MTTPIAFGSFLDHFEHSGGRYLEGQFIIKSHRRTSYGPSTERLRLLGSVVFCLEAGCLGNCFCLMMKLISCDLTFVRQ